MRRLVLHIGDCKTGSTSIQKALRRGTFSGFDVPLHFPASMNHIPISRAFDSGDSEPLLDLARTAGEGITVISAEHFEFVDPLPLAKALRSVWQDDLCVIGYVRPHAEALFARYCENLKIGNLRGDPLQFHKAMLGRRRLFYAERFARWRCAFGDDFVLRPFVRDELSEGDVVTDFMETAVGKGASAGDCVRHNPVPSVEALSLLRAIFDVIGREPESKGARTAFGRNFARHLEGFGAVRPQMERALALEVIKAYREDARLVDAQYFGRNVLEQALISAPERAADRGFTLEVSNYFTPETLTIAMAFARTIEPLLFERPGVVSQILRQNFVAGVPSEGRIAERREWLNAPKD